MDLLLGLLNRIINFKSGLDVIQWSNLGFSIRFLSRSTRVFFVPMMLKRFGKIWKLIFKPYQLSQQIWSLQQGSMDLATYYATLKTLWDELDGANCVNSFRHCDC